MDCGKFILSGDDKKTLSIVKNTLTSNGHNFMGYLKEPTHLLRCIRTNQPDFLVVEAGNNLKELRSVLEIIDEETLAACIIILERRNDDIIDFLKKSKVLSYITKPVFDEAILQVIDISLINFERVVEYERKVKKLNDTLESRKVVEKAKWILVQKEGYTEEQAYEAIRKKSRDNRITMKEIAEALILTRG
ncbi:MAG: ANTAR domain-containing protein [Bacillota bacterium]|nr:ANTAR domain-containing protein [Bacillota bacterium]